AASGDLLGPLESAVMERLWKRGPATVRDVVDDLGRSRGLAYTTVMTVMVRLQAKGMLRRERNGKTYVYRPAFSREEHRARLSRDLARGPDDVVDAVTLLLLVLATCGIALGMGSLFRQLLATLTLLRALVAKRITTPDRVRALAHELGLDGRIDVVVDPRPFSFTYW